ncbi:VRR-NUC domain-containing protein [Deinococcus sp. HMF7604]|uniref:VRR-NUC domain-containing protein n=1 Tax=Deinococcus betulae TaxID=2873312 RepID=UPI001CCE397E|nr:VRR-NUC domain-containing protein [Deinococcus betulae]MBZ9753200.1 VRR-NUC domain-containing protein [Deinococcus betulae]
MRYGTFSTVADAEAYLAKLQDPTIRARTRTTLGLPELPLSLTDTYLPASALNGYATEALFQADVVAELRAFGWRVQETLKGSDRGGAVWYTPGFPDLQAYRAHRLHFFLELKQPGKRPTQTQLECHAGLRAAGYRVTVAYTLAQALKAAQEELCPSDS